MITTILFTHHIDGILKYDTKKCHFIKIIMEMFKEGQKKSVRGMQRVLNVVYIFFSCKWAND